MWAVLQFIPQTKGISVMKKIGLILLLTWLAPFVAQADGPAYSESLYMFKTKNVTPVSAADCSWANGFLGEGVESIGGNMQDLYSVQSKVTTGQLKHDKKKVGELHACASDGHY